MYVELSRFTFTSHGKSTIADTNYSKQFFATHLLHIKM